MKIIIKRRLSKLKLSLYIDLAARSQIYSCDWTAWGREALQASLRKRKLIKSKNSHIIILLIILSIKFHEAKAQQICGKILLLSHLGRIFRGRNKKSQLSFRTGR